MERALAEYAKKRNFAKTPEPRGRGKIASKKARFVLQKHAASHLHFDFRLEMGRSLKSWAIPKGPSTLPSEKRLAMLTEDHPLAYANFEGVIPVGEYGAGVVMLWDRGSYVNIKKDEKGKIIPMKKCFEMGHIEIFLKGERVQGAYALVRFKKPKHWLFIKMRDAFAGKNRGLLRRETRSVKTGRTLREIKRFSAA